MYARTYITLNVEDKQIFSMIYTYVIAQMYSFHVPSDKIIFTTIYIHTIFVLQDQWSLVKNACPTRCLLRA